MPNSQSSLFGTPAFAAEVAARRAYALAVSDAVNRAQTAYNSGLIESPWDWRAAGINLMKDIARTNAQRYGPGVFPPFGNVLPRFLPRKYPPGVLTPAKRGVSAGPIAGPIANAGALPLTAAPDAQPMFASPTGGTGAGSGLIGAPYTQPIPREGAPMASVQPAGAGTNATHVGPNGAIGFTGRKVECSAPAGGVDIMGPQTGTPPTPVPNITIEPQPVEPPVIPLREAPCPQPSGNPCLDLRNGLLRASQVSPDVFAACSSKGYAGNCVPPSCVAPGPHMNIPPNVIAALPQVASGELGACPSYGMSGAFSIGCRPSAGVPQVQAAEQQASGTGGISPWWWLLLAGLGIWAMSGSDETRPRLRRRA